MTTQPTPLDPTKTVRHPGRSGRREIWEATSADGRWLFIRIEDSGTPWDVIDLSVGEAHPARRPWMDSTLISARRWTAAQTTAA